MVRSAAAGDLEQVAAIYDAVHTEEEAGRMSVGWRRNVYPTEQTARAALERGELFVEERDGRVTACGILNQTQLPEYAQCPWKHPAEDGEVMVLHTLVVHPAEGGKGCAREFVGFYEDYARSRGCRVLRIDTQEKNAAARRLYAGLGFTEAGIIQGMCFNGISGVGLVCLEKALTDAEN